MPSFKTTFVLAATMLSASAQYSIDPNSVPLATRQSWCQSQTATCPELCRQINSTYYTQNSCDAASLTYACVCGNGQTPNVNEYSLTLPYFICTEYGTQCVAACKSDNTCASACRQNHPCGAQDPVRINATTATTSATTSATAGSASETVYNGFGDGSSSPKSAGNLVIDSGAGYGFAVLFAGVLAGFALL